VLISGRDTSIVSRPQPDAGRQQSALFRLGRFWLRRWAGMASAEPGHVQHIRVVEAVQTYGGQADVVTVAHQLGLDHSGASRLVRDAVAAGYLVRGTSASDRRRRASLRLTDSGHVLLAEITRARVRRRRSFDELTSTWDERDRRHFCLYLRKTGRRAAQRLSNMGGGRCPPPHRPRFGSPIRTCYMSSRRRSGPSSQWASRRTRCGELPSCSCRGGAHATIRDCACGSAPGNRGV
jgi:DNA-binding MarR family transcriptional regulator